MGELAKIDIEIGVVKKDSDDLMRLAKSSIADEQKGVLDDLRKRADDDQQKLNHAKDKIQLMKKRLTDLDDAANKQLKTGNLPKVAEDRLKKMKKDILDNKKKI